VPINDNALEEFIQLHSGESGEGLSADEYRVIADVGELIYKPNTVDDLCAVVARLA